MSSLDTSQFAAATTAARRVLVLAGAGSGKTRTLVHRVLHLIIEQNIPPERIALCTFTQRAAQEMRTRIRQKLGSRALQVRSGTFHALALQMLRRYSAAIGLDPRFTLIGRSEQQLLVQEALVSAGVDPRNQGLSPERFLRLLGLAQNHEIPLSEALVNSSPEWLPRAQQLESAADAYAHAKASVTALDFDDLLVLLRVLIDPSSPVSGQLRNQFDHVLVDEYQDTTPLQASLTEDLTGPDKALFVVGDDAQSIYGFRGARFDNILEFPTRAPTEVHRLLVSYRNSPAVINLAQATLDLNPLQFPKPLRSALPDGPPVCVIKAENEEDEARYIAQSCLRLTQFDIPFAQQAILLRRHRDTAHIELALTEARVPYNLSATQKFLDRPHIANLLAHLRVLLRPSDLIAWRRVFALRPGVGPVSVRRLTDAVENALHMGWEPIEFLKAGEFSFRLQGRTQEGVETLADLLQKLSSRLNEGFGSFIRYFLDQEDPGIKSIVLKSDESIREDFERMKRISSPTQDVLDAFSLGPESEAASESDDRVFVGTIHSAKGLEWQAVFVANLCEGRFPADAALHQRDGEAEERRLFYVAVTRAAQHLVLSYPCSTKTARGIFENTPSRFIQELPSKLFHRG